MSEYSFLPSLYNPASLFLPWFLSLAALLRVSRGTASRQERNRVLTPHNCSRKREFGSFALLDRCRFDATAPVWVLQLSWTELELMPRPTFLPLSLQKSP